MKTTKLLSATIAAGLAGVALVKFGSASFLAGLPGDKLFLVAVGLAVTAFAAYDYSRRHEPLRVKATLTRPTMPSAKLPSVDRCQRNAA